MEDIYVVISFVEGRDLDVQDMNGLSDPYVKLVLTGLSASLQAQKYTTKTVKETLYPIWNENYIVKLKYGEKYRCTFDLFDWDKITRDDPLGHVQLDFPALPGCRIDEFKELAMKTKKGDHGYFHVRIQGFMYEFHAKAFALGRGGFMIDTSDRKLIKKLGNTMATDAEHSHLYLIFFTIRASSPYVDKPPKEPFYSVFNKIYGSKETEEEKEGMFHCRKLLKYGEISEEKSDPYPLGNLIYTTNSQNKFSWYVCMYKETEKKGKGVDNVFVGITGHWAVLFDKGLASVQKDVIGVEVSYKEGHVNVVSCSRGERSTELKEQCKSTINRVYAICTLDMEHAEFHVNIVCLVGLESDRISKKLSFPFKRMEAINGFVPIVLTAQPETFFEITEIHPDEASSVRRSLPDLPVSKKVSKF